MASLRDMYSAAKAAPESSFQRTPKLGREVLADGIELIVEITFFKAGKGKSGGLKFTGISKIIEGGPGEGELWTGINFSAKEDENGARFNRQAFAKLEALGFDEGFLDSDPSPEAIAKAAVGKRFRLIVGWDDESDFDRHQWVAIDDGGPLNQAIGGTGFRPSI